MDSRQLAYFKTIYEQGTLTRASEELHLASSALSHHVANLEAELKVKLFDRQPRGMKPTAAGTRLYLHASKITKAIDEAARDLGSASSHFSGPVSISMAYSLIKLIGVSLAQRVLTGYPDVKLSLIESLSGLSIEHIVSAQVDLALAYNPPMNGSLELLPILEESMVLIGHENVIGPGTEPIVFEELLNFPLFLLGRGLSAKVVISDPKLLREVEDAAILNTYSVHAIRRLVLAGLGCVIAPRTLMSEYTGKDGLNMRAIIEPELVRTLYLCELPDRTPSFALEAIKVDIFRLIDECLVSEAWIAKRLMPEDWPKA